MNPVEQFIANYEAFEYSHVSTDTVKFKTGLDAALVYVQRKNVLVRAKEEKTLRDEFAASVMQGLMASQWQVEEPYAIYAYKVADAMLEAREK